MLHRARRFLASTRFTLAAATVLALTVAQPGLAQAQGLFSQPKYAAIVLDANSGEVLYGKRPDELRYPASITKVMTLYLTFEALATGRLGLNDTVTISPHAYSMAPSKISTHPGETLSVAQAIQAVTVHSANDVAVALAEKVGGTEPRFAQLMTLRAQELGMSRSHFVNASGLPDDRQIVTARDIATLSRAIMRDYPQYYAYFGEKSFDYHGKVLTNHNHLLMKMPGVDGIKTGFTNAAGFNLAASAVRGGHRLITVVLGGPSTAARDENVEELLDAGFNVMSQRASGRRITLASIISEPDDLGPVQRAPIEQGSADQANLQVEVRPQMPAPPVMIAAKALTAKTVPVITLAPTPAVAAEARPDCAAPQRSRSARRHAAKACQAILAAEARQEKAAHKAEKQTAEARGAPQVAAPKRDGETEAKAEAIAGAQPPCVPRYGRHRHAKACASVQTAQATTPAKAVSPSTGGFMIQVGAYKNQGLAQGQVDKVAGLVRGSGAVERAGTNFRARFRGLSQQEAKSACAALTAKKQSCMVMSGAS